MNKMVVVVFDNEVKAYEGSRALKELHAEGSITLHATAVIAKDDKGKVEIKQAVDRGASGTILGLATGSLIGLLAGPVGLVLGAAAGGLSGSIVGLAKAGVEVEFLEEVTQSLKPGKAAVVAEVAEEWVIPLDTRMEALGGTVFRRARKDVVDTQIQRDVAALRGEVQELKSEAARASAEARARVEKKIDAVNVKLAEARDCARERIDALDKEARAKLEALEEQIGKAGGEVKARLQERAAAVRDEYELRVAKLGAAFELAREALAPRVAKSIRPASQSRVTEFERPQPGRESLGGAQGRL